MTSPLVSVVVPVYNEVATIGILLDRLLEFEFSNVRFEVVIVESNSTDGSREVVIGYEHHPRVTLVLQEHARGKGNAVREALQHVRGDVVVIQDGDLEYRIDDYPVLLTPIFQGRADVVLGCRHVAGQPMRDIPEKRLLSQALNLAHWAFAGLFNLTYGVRLRDPFTMYKVFRRECIEGMELVSNRFDFDWELLGKLVRRGYKPIEVPVRYKSRSFQSGKKVRLFKDPPTWIRACFRFRFCRLPSPPVGIHVLRPVSTNATSPLGEPELPSVFLAPRAADTPLEREG